MRSIAAIVILAGVLVALLAAGVATGFAVRDARVERASQLGAATALVATGGSPATLEAMEWIASAKSYRGDEVLFNYTRDAATPRFLGIAQRLAPPEVNCGAPASPPADAGGVPPPATVCIETTAIPLARALSPILTAAMLAAGAAVLLGVLAATWIGRSVASPLGRIADVVDRASRERDWSLRVPPATGDQGRIAASVNGLLAQMQERDVAIRRRTTELEALNKELESFAYSVSHDLRAPLGSIDGFTQALETDYAHLYDDTAREYIGWVREGCSQMRELIDGLLQMTRLARSELEHEQVDLSSIAQSIAETLQQSSPARAVKFDIRQGVRATGDARLLRAVLENLMTNAWKFTRNRDEAHIEFGVRDGAFFVRDNGAGFDPSHAAKMFRPFQRLHSSREFEGTGIGLATVQKIVERHGGRAWAEGEVGKGATIYFTTAEAT